MSLRGNLKWGVLNRFDIPATYSTVSRSVARNFLTILRCCRVLPGPSRILMPAFPNWPGPGTRNAEGSNHRSTRRSPDGILPSAIRSGCPPVVLVFDGSAPENEGEKKGPDLKNVRDTSSQPPTIWSRYPGT